jgi:hypothetical protein
LPGLATSSATHTVVIEIGGLPIRLHADDSEFIEQVKERYAGFVATNGAPAKFDFEVNLASPAGVPLDEDASVEWRDGRWLLQRGDFQAEWDPQRACGVIRQTANPYSLDSVLRIVHSLLLAREGGFLVHASSAIRNGHAFLFAGVSGAGKTTIARLAPADVNLLTDEISYVTAEGERYFAHGTPFAGELARVGEPLRAPIESLYLLTQGPENSIESLPPVVAVRLLMRNILFFAKDMDYVERVFQSACDFTARVPVKRLTFVPDARVWELIG